MLQAAFIEFCVGACFLKRHVYRAATLPVRVIVVAVSLVEAILRPAYRPIVNAIMTLGVVTRLEAWIATLPRLAILLLLAVPFAIAEPMKVVALVIIARGHVAIGVVTLIAAYLATFLIVERIYHAGREKLLTYRWLAWVMRYVALARSLYDGIKLSAVGWLRAVRARFLR